MSFFTNSELFLNYHLQFVQEFFRDSCFSVNDVVGHGWIESYFKGDEGVKKKLKIFEFWFFIISA